jgi:hypothetical protein
MEVTPCNITLKQKYIKFYQTKVAYARYHIYTKTVYLYAGFL